ncbi:MAG: CC_3452 family protein [Brevundimonas sp.]
MRALLIAAALFAAAPAFAQAPAATSAVLADAARAPAAATIIDGAAWRCEGGTCTASGGANQPATRACRRVVARLGAVSSFSYKGVALTAEQIAACNA